MIATNSFASLRTGQAVPRDQVPNVPFADFRRAVVDAVRARTASRRLLRRRLRLIRRRGRSSPSSPTARARSLRVTRHDPRLGPLRLT